MRNSETDNDNLTINNDPSTGVSNVDPTTGTIIYDSRSDKAAARRDRVSTVAAFCLIGFGLWGTYSHRVDARLAPPSESPGIVYNQSSIAAAHPAPLSNATANPKALLNKLETRLAQIQTEAQRRNQLPGHRLLSRRVERLQQIVSDRLADPKESTYVQRNLIELDGDLSAFESDINQLPTQ